MPNCPFTHPSDMHDEVASKSSASESKCILPPGPDRSPESLTADWFARPYAFLSELALIYGDIFSLRFAHIGTQVIVSRPNHLKTVFLASADQLHAGKGNEILRILMGTRSPMLLDGAEHLNRRKAMLPAFHPNQIAHVMAVMEEVLSAVTERWRDGDTVVFQAEVLEISLRILLRSIFGVHEELALQKLITLIQKFVTIVGTQSVLRNTNRSAGRDQNIRSIWERQFKIASEAVDKELYRHLDERRQFKKPKNSRSDILDMLLDIVDDNGQPLSNEVLRDYLMTLFIAGHETSAASLSWAIHWVLNNKRVYQNLDEDLANTVGSQGTYLEAVCHETLRICPPISEVSRKLQSPLFLDSYYLPVGVSVCPSIFLAHHRPETFDEPHVFRPERFLERKYTPYEYLPFGGGSRRCIGMSLAFLEMKTVLAHFIRNFRFENVENATPNPIRRAVLVTPSTAGRVRVWRK